MPTYGMHASELQQQKHMTFGQPFTGTILHGTTHCLSHLAVTLIKVFFQSPNVLCDQGPDPLKFGHSTSQKKTPPGHPRSNLEAHSVPATHSWDFFVGGGMSAPNRLGMLFFASCLLKPSNGFPQTVFSWWMVMVIKDNPTNKT